VSVLIDAASRVLIYGIAGNFGRFSARDLASYGTQVVAGVATGRDAREVEGVPVFQNARAACARPVLTLLSFTFPPCRSRRGGSKC